MIIRDDSHAKAILKRILREIGESADPKTVEKLAKERLQTTHSKKKMYHYTIEAYNRILGHSIIHTRAIKPKLASKKEITYWIHFGLEAIDNELKVEFRAQNLIPICTISISNYNMFDDHADYLMLISEHAAIKMIRRNQLDSIVKFTNCLKNYVVSVMSVSSYLDAKDWREFVAISSEAYMPIVISEYGIPLVKTWVSRDSWTPENEAKLSGLCDRLKTKNQIEFMTTTNFNRYKYIDPNDSSLFLSKKQ